LKESDSDLGDSGRNFGNSMILNGDLVGFEWIRLELDGIRVDSSGWRPVVVILRFATVTPLRATLAHAAYAGAPPSRFLTMFKIDHESILSNSMEFYEIPRNSRSQIWLQDSGNRHKRHNSACIWVSIRF
jgi:hypothetical protein